MRTRSLLASLWLACAPTPEEARPPSPSPAAAPASAPAETPPPAEAPPAAPEPEPTGDRLTMTRTACYGPCPTYDLTIFPDGRVLWRGLTNVSRVGRVDSTIAPAVAAELITAAEALDHAHLPHDPDSAVCGTDMPGVALTLHRDTGVRTVVVDASCTLRLCDDRGRNCSDSGAELRRRGLSRKAMLAVDRLADRIDEVTGAAVWMNDPDCRELPRERLAPGLLPASAAPDDPERRLRGSSYATIVAALQRDPQAVVRIAGRERPAIADMLAQHRRALLDHGVAATRVGTEIVLDYHALPADGAIELTVGPRKCFGAAFPGRAG